MTDVSYSVLIPCHKDCEKALALKTEVCRWTSAPVFIGHNGCPNDLGPRWANKARVINEFARFSFEEYIVVLDADVRLEGNPFAAFEQKMRDGVLFGSALVVHRYTDDEVEHVDDRAEYNGAAWFCQRIIVTQVGVPEDIITEDTAFGMLLKKRKVKAVPALGAVVSVLVDEPTFSKQYRQAVRYAVGGYQLFAKRLSYAEGISMYAVMSFNMFLVASAAVSKISFLALLGYSVLILIGSLQVYKSNGKTKLSRASVVNFLNYTIVPFVAYYRFVRRKWVW